MSGLDETQLPREVQEELQRLRSENLFLRRFVPNDGTEKVKTPPQVRPVFDRAEKIVGDYFRNFVYNPSQATITISGERYLLVRASSLTHEFLKTIHGLYSDRSAAEADAIGRNFLFDIAHVIGTEDARQFHEKMGLEDPIEKLSAGPVHFAYTGWAFVDILPESNPSPDENFHLHYHHPFSFEADSWVNAGKKADAPVCIMNAGYSSGWCEASFGIPLTAVEISCKACGDEHCTFIMAPPDRIGEYLPKHVNNNTSPKYDVPLFFERKRAEEKLRTSLREKEVLLQEVHHRVKNNLQIISSLLNLQSAHIVDEQAQQKFSDSISRIHSMALIHEMLYKSKDFSQIDFGEYAQTLVQSLRQGYIADKEIDLQLRVSMSTPLIDLDKAITLGLLLNEMVSNAFKHAFSGREGGQVQINLTETSDQKIELMVCDNGIGLPEKIFPGNGETLGMQLIESLAMQLDASTDIDRSKGTCYRMIFDR